MATEGKLRIGYAGSLAAYRPGEERVSFFSKLRNWFWTYQRRNIGFHTRSGYFLFKGIAEFKRSYPDLADKLQVDLWGVIQPGNAEQVKSMGIADIVNISGHMPRAESRERLKTYDVLFLPLESSLDGQEPLFIPGKLYEYLEMRKPVLALTGESDCGRILGESGLGIICDPHDTAALAAALADLVRNRETLSGRFEANSEWLDSRFSFEALSGKLASVFDQALDENRR